MEKGILFNKEMVQEILKGRKTCTRRVIKPQPKSLLCFTFAGAGAGTWGYPFPGAEKSWGEQFKLPESISREELERRWTPPAHTGDTLYVRETWCMNEGKYYYLADKGTDRAEKFDYDSAKWKPSIHMPKEASRLWLKVKSIQMERLQEITWQQAANEGCYGSTSDEPDPLFHLPTLRGEFRRVWESTLRPEEMQAYGWDANPFVWVIEFEREETQYEM